MKNFFERKQVRTEEYFRDVYGWVLVTCSACSGSGRYDHYRSPRCGCCDGTGRTRERGSKNIEKMRERG